MSFWSPNIERRGRLARGITALVLLAAAVILWRADIAVWPWVVGVSGLFVLFEAVRGWCLLRACKIRTPM